MDFCPCAVENASKSGPLVASGSPKLKGITVDKSVEFSFEELAIATNDFDMSCKIGQGGFGSVYYGELRGEVCSYIIRLLNYRQQHLQCITLLWFSLVGII